MQIGDNYNESEYYFESGNTLQKKIYQSHRPDSYDIFKGKDNNLKQWN